MRPALLAGLALDRATLRARATLEEPDVRLEADPGPVLVVEEAGARLELASPTPTASSASSSASRLCAPTGPDSPRPGAPGRFSEINMETFLTLTRPFEAKPFTTLTWRSRPAWVARHVGQVLGYSGQGKRLTNKILGQWNAEFADTLRDVLDPGAMIALKVVAGEIATGLSIESLFDGDDDPLVDDDAQGALPFDRSAA